MDGATLKHSALKHTSLQRDLRKWLLILVATFCVVGSLISFAAAYIQAKELQDDLLEQIATWLQAGNSINTQSLRYDLDDESIVVQSLAVTQPLQFPTDLESGLGYVDINEATWRILVVQHQDQLYAIAQETDIREKLALSSALASAIPMLLLSLSLLVGLQIIIKRLLRPINQLAAEVNQRDSDDLTRLHTDHVPEEITPFIHAINRLMGRVEQGIKRQQRFIADAAHELRTPVSGLSIQAENLQNNKQADVSNLRSGLNRLQSLVEQLLNLARLQADTPTREEVISVNELLQDVVISLHPIADRKEQDLGVEKIETIKITNRDNHLWHIFQNAISNAIEYSPEGKTINVSLYEEDNQLVFIVDDNGPGIDSETMKHVFEPFHRGRSHANKSNGLGLAICEEISRKNRGRLILENLDQGGMRFRYQQPLS